MALDDAALETARRDNRERTLEIPDPTRPVTDAIFESAFDQAGIGAGIFDLAGLAVRVNTAVCTLFGRPEEDLIGRQWADFNHPDDVPVAIAVAGRMGFDRDDYSDERRYLRPDGSVVWASLCITLVRDGDGEPHCFLAQLQDVTERKQMEERLAYQSLHDPLTDLPNRALLSDRIEQGLVAARRRGTQVGLIFLDLDDFKMINDGLGYSHGDNLLKSVAARISAAIRESDTAGRFGGDEFVIVCDEVSLDETEQIADRVREALGRPHLIDGHEVTATASFGVAVADGDATPDTLLRNADAAMYQAKAEGRGRVAFFDEALRTKVEHRIFMASALRGALHRQELSIDYQPIMDLRTQEMIGVEALLRWNSAERGSISPVQFIPVAEESGLILPIGAWALEQACRQLAVWQKSEPSMTVAVNLSVRQLIEPDIAKVVDDILTRTGVDPRGLTLELTESVFMKDGLEVIERMVELKSLGVKLAIDDFGTGYSSLSYLKRFPVDSVKVDKAFVDGLGTDPYDFALVAAIVAMADALDLTVIAEGVESQAQLHVLTRLRCQQAQGFHLGRPMPAAAIDRLIEKPPRWPTS